MDEYSIDNIYKSLYGDLIVKGFFSNIDEEAMSDINFYQYNIEDSISDLIIICDLSEVTDYNNSITEIIQLKDNLKKNI